MSSETFYLPDLGEGLTEADLVSWLVAKGDTIVVDQPIAEVETAKALVEVPSPYAGVVTTLHGEPGETLLVGAPLLTVGDGTEQSEPEPAQSDNGDKPGALSYREEERAGIKEADDDEGSGSVLIGYGTTGQGPGGRTRARKRQKSQPAAEHQPESSVSQRSAVPRVISPLVRLLAKRHNIDISTITGTGPDGVIRRSDVEAAMNTATEPEKTPSAPVATPGHDQRSDLPISQRVPIQGLRKTVAEHMSRSRASIPEATAWLDVDVTELLELRSRLKQLNPETAPSLLALVARFTVAALQRYPVMNSRIVDAEDGNGQEIVMFDGINLGIAAQTDRGLVVPSIAQAQRYSARQLTEQLDELLGRARDGKSTPQELTRGTFTLNNYGVLGTDGAAAIINAPEVAILGIGRIIDRPWVVDGELAVRKVTELTLSFDHRVTDGAVASAFLTDVAAAMHDPQSAVADM